MATLLSRKVVIDFCHVPVGTERLLLSKYNLIFFVLQYKNDETTDSGTSEYRILGASGTSDDGGMTYKGKLETI